MITVTSQQLTEWIVAFLWPLTRVLGLVATAPLLNHTAIPARVKVLLGVLITIAVAPSAPAPGGLDPLSATGVLVLAHQLIIGLAMGFVMRIVFAAVDMAGEVAGITMGLSFATLFDPASQGRTTALSRFLSLLTLMVFLSMDAHLYMIRALGESFSALPVGAGTGGSGGAMDLAKWAGVVFAAGLQLAMPVIGMLLIINMALGILTRAAPQLNLFAVGFPVTLTAGLLVLILSLAPMAAPLQALIQEGLRAASSLRP